MRVGIIGGGRAAWAFASTWQRAGQPLAGFTLRPASTSSVPELVAAPRLPLGELLAVSDLVILAVRDDVLAETASRIATLAPPSAALAHLSGIHTSELFHPHELRASMHPLLALPPAPQQISLSAALLVAEGTAGGMRVIEQAASLLGGRLVTIAAEAKPLYHTAAVFAANYVATLLTVAEELMAAAGIEVPYLPADLARLALSATTTWRDNEGVSRFTGPAVRGDAAVVSQHLSSIADRPAVAALYRALARELVARLPERRRSEIGPVIEVLDSGTLP